MECKESPQKQIKTQVQKRPAKSPGAEGYLQITCPAQGCKQHLVLHCPYCQHGALQVDEGNSMLVCEHCKNPLKAITCGCGFTIRSDYIAKRQKQLRYYKEQIDTGAYQVILTLLGSIGLFVLLHALFS